jgi:uncharacterized protein (TIGR02246 family)
MRTTIAALIFAATAAGCAAQAPIDPAAQRFADREAIEALLDRSNRGFELSDPDLFANAFAPDAVYELAGQGPVFGYDKMRYQGRDDIRSIVAVRVERAKKADPTKLTYDPASLRRFNRNTDSRIEFLDPAHAHHTSTWMVVMHTNVDIHISAIGRYDDLLEKRDGNWLITKRTRSE